MSVDKLSEALRSRITSRLREVITNRGKEELTQRRLNNFAEYTSGTQIRKDTDTVIGRHESVMSRDSFDLLLMYMSDAIESKKLSNELSKAVANASFDGFVAFISKVYYKDEEFLISDNRRVKNGFVYSGPTRATKETVAVYAKAQNAAESYRDVLILKNIPQGKLVEYYVEYISESFGKLNPATKKQLKDSLQGGHLTGVFTARLVRAFGLRKDSAGQVGFNTNTAPLTDLEKQLDLIVKLVTDADYLSSNIIRDVELFTETDKRLFTNASEIRLTTEVQFKDANKAAGDLLTTAGTYLSKLIKSVSPNTSQTGQDLAAQEAFKKLLLNLNKVSLYVKDRATQLNQISKDKTLDPVLTKKLTEILENQKVFETLITTEGSPSLLKHVTNLVVNGIKGTNTKSSTTKVKLKEKVKITSKAQSIKPVKKYKSKSSNLRFKEKAIKYGVATSVSNLTSLQNLLNASLVEQVKKNMGNGTRRDVLNLRTGRFAESVEVTRLSESRQGMITAFYTYMKNPYATFSAGGRQEYPRSRDPKLLIAKSIREIAAQQVGNRLRSVLV